MQHCLIHVGFSFCCVDTFLILIIQVFLFSGGADHIIRLWELDNSLCVQEYRGHGDLVRWSTQMCSCLPPMTGNWTYTHTCAYTHTHTHTYTYKFSTHTNICLLVKVIEFVNFSFSTVHKWNIHCAQCLMEYYGLEAFCVLVSHFIADYCA